MNDDSHDHADDAEPGQLEADEGAADGIEEKAERREHEHALVGDGARAEIVPEEALDITADIVERTLKLLTCSESWSAPLPPADVFNKYPKDVQDEIIAAFKKQTRPSSPTSQRGRIGLPTLR